MISLLFQRMERMMVNEPIKFPDRCRDCHGPLSPSIAYLNAEVKEGRKKRYILVGPLCDDCANKRRAKR